MKRRVLFLCTGNSCRSQMAEAIVNARRGQSWQAFSAGTEPANEVHPKAIQTLTEIGIPAAGLKPQHINEYLNQPFDLVVTVCDHAAEQCPVWPGQGQRIHLGFPDPASVNGTAEEALTVFRRARDDIAEHILALLDAVTDVSER